LFKPPNESRSTIRNILVKEILIDLLCNEMVFVKIGEKSLVKSILSSFMNSCLYFGIFGEAHVFKIGFNAWFSQELIFRFETISF
jgi:hypothetical protein